jgi:sugar porter (SP) family MFS transporter
VADDVWVFIAFRIVGGLGVGIASTSTPMYIAEITPAHLRGRMVSVNQIAIVGGMAGVAFANYFIAHCGDQDWNIFTGWRWMFAVGVVPSTAFLVFLLPIPESPRWLAEKGHNERAAEILRRVGGSEFANKELAAIRDALAVERSSWKELFSSRLRVPLFLGIALASLQQVTGINAFLYFGASIFKSMSNSTGVEAGLLQQIVISGSCMLATVAAIATVDLWGRKPLMIVGAAGMGLSLAAMGLMAQGMSDPGAASGTMLALIVVYIACFGLSVGPVTWVILSEIFPTSVRGRALGLATFCLWISDFAVTQSFPMMTAKDSWFVANFNHAFPFFLYSAFCAILITVVRFGIPETKGRSLEEIEAFWR